MKTPKSVAHAPDEILAELRTLVSEAEGMAGNALDATDDAAASLRSRYESAQARLANMYGRAKRGVVDSAAYADETIRENPYKTMAIVAGVGLLVGVLVTMRRSNR
ncbi:MAG: DUF883 family protein [Acidobacteria bacterium]|nr:DUF883 family protein [Acidobacteriota bacterium]